MTASPSRGEIWRAGLDPARGHEQGRFRPVLIVSNNTFNHGTIGLVTVIPLTSKGRPIRTWLKTDPPEGGLPQTSFIICDQVRTISKERLGKRLGAVSPHVMAEVEWRLKYLLDLR
jgi:mRNA interferase MazF